MRTRILQRLNWQGETCRLFPLFFFIGLFLAGLQFPAAAQAPAGLVSWWPGEGNAIDIVGTNNGITTSITYTNGEVGQAFDFNGSGSFIKVPASSSLNVGLASGFTVEMWVNPVDIYVPSRQVQDLV
jgi:hypothetical protein